MDDIQIIENTEEARETYGYWWGSSQLILTKEMINALLNGKCVACNDGEYSTFVILEKEDEEQ